METHAATPLVVLSFDSSKTSAALPVRPMFAAAATAPTAVEKAGAVALLLGNAAPIAVLVWVLSAWLGR